MLLKILILNFTIFILIVPENFDNCIDTEDETLSKNLFFSLCYRLGVELQTFQQKSVQNRAKFTRPIDFSCIGRMSFCQRSGQKRLLRCDKFLFFWFLQVIHSFKTKKNQNEKNLFHIRFTFVSQCESHLFYTNYQFFLHWQNVVFLEVWFLHSLQGLRSFKTKTKCKKK